MIILALLIFSFCLWAVFSESFVDGIVSKILFSVSAITSALVIHTPDNTDAMLTSYGLLVAGASYWGLKHRINIGRGLRQFIHR